MAKVLTIKQPWASLIVNGYKTIENRTWSTKYRGRLLIHAGKSSDNSITDKEILKDIDELDKPLPKSAIIGEAQLVNCTKDDIDDKYSEKGAVHWVLDEIVKYDKPIVDVNGKLGLWNYDE